MKILKGKDICPVCGNEDTYAIWKESINNPMLRRTLKRRCEMLDTFVLTDHFSYKPPKGTK